MKKIAIMSTLISAFVLHNAFAADGTVSFTGKITATACKIQSSSTSVVMGSISTSAFGAPGAAGNTAAGKAFNIVLTDCPSGSNHINLRFDGTPDASNPSILALSPVPGVASNVGIALYESDGNTLIPLNTNTLDKTIEAGTNTLPYVAKYMSTAASVTAGSADSTASFTIIYP
ncbi:type 1 fimbrial protein [Citrobacter braakii]|nr:type 1 fimbrial protein [Citrobacter braakii]